MIVVVRGTHFINMDVTTANLIGIDGFFELDVLPDL